MFGSCVAFVVTGVSSSLEFDRLAGLMDDIERFVKAAFCGVGNGGGLFLLAVADAEVDDVDWDDTPVVVFVCFASEIRRVG